MLFELTLRFSSGVECKVKYCKELGYREHFHCMDCNFRVFIKKEEMVRHYKWHRKREESLQHGFMRYSPLDDCSQKYGTCTHNGRQTHYHCLQVSQRCKPPCRMQYMYCKPTVIHQDLTSDELVCDDLFSQSYAQICK